MELSALFSEHTNLPIEVVYHDIFKHLDDVDRDILSFSMYGKVPYELAPGRDIKKIIYDVGLTNYMEYWIESHKQRALEVYHADPPLTFKTLTSEREFLIAEFLRNHPDIMSFCVKSRDLEMVRFIKPYALVEEVAKHYPYPFINAGNEGLGELLFSNHFFRIFSLHNGKSVYLFYELQKEIMEQARREYLLNIFDIYDIGEMEDGRLPLRRKKAGCCCVCNQVHETGGGYLVNLKDDGKFYFRCNHAPKKDLKLITHIKKPY